MSATIYTVAEKCGVSSATVSRALRRHPSVKTETADKICAVAEQLGYRPSLAARSLISRNSSLFSRMERPIFIPFNQTATPFSDPLFFDYFCGLMDRVGSGPYRAELVRFKDSSKEFETVRKLVDQKEIAGLMDFQLLMPTIKYLLKTEIPMVTTDLGNARLGIPGVFADYVEGYRQAWRHVIELGHRRVGYFGIDIPSNRYEECLAGAALEGALERLIPPVRVPDLDSSDENWKRLKAALGDYCEDRWPTLFFVQNDFIACRLVGLLQSHHISVPGQISIVGFDDSASAVCTTPSLTTIDKPRAKIGYELANLLLDIISGRIRKRDFMQKLPMSLVIRESTAHAPERTQRRKASSQSYLLNSKK